MKNLSLTALVLVASAIDLAAPTRCVAQQPKMDIKLFAGGSFTTYVAMLETGRERDTFPGWQVGFGARVRRGKWFIEGLLSFNRWKFAGSLEDFAPGAGVTGRVNSFELPINGGYIPFQNPYFKLFVYAGYVNHFNTKILASIRIPDAPSISVKFRPKDIDLAIYQALARLGINFDLTLFNFDFNYSISMNSATSTSYRTGYHQVQFNLAYLF